MKKNLFLRCLLMRYKMKNKNYVLRTKNDNLEIIKILAQENMTSINKYLNIIIENHIFENKMNDSKKSDN